VADQPDGGTVDPKGELTKAVTNAAVKVVGAFATTAGFVAFVAVTGQAITWVRFRAAELPADQAVQLVPKDDLVVVGGLALGIFAVLGVVAVTSVYAIDRYGQDCDEMRPGLCVLITGEVLVAIQFAAGGNKLAMSLFAGFMGLLAVVLTMLPVFYKHRTNGVPLWNVQQAAPAGGPPAAPAAGQGGPPPAGGPPAAPAAGQGGPPPAGGPPAAPEGGGAERSEDGPRHTLTRPGLVCAALLAVVWVGAFWLCFKEPLVAYMSGLAAALAAVCFGVARASGSSFWPYGLAVFFSVTLFGAALNAARLWEVPKGHPVALLRAGNSGTSGVVGLLVAKTDDRYWLGVVTLRCADGEPADTPKGASGRIFSIPRAQVLDDELGTATRLKNAQAQALTLFAELKVRQPPGGSLPPRGDSMQATTGTEGQVGQQTEPAKTTVTAPKTPAVQIPRPKIAALRPPSPLAKQKVRLIGTNLSDVTSVTVGGEDVDATSSSDTAVSFVAPTALAGKRVRVKSCWTSRPYLVPAKPGKPPPGDEKPPDEPPKGPRKTYRHLGDEYFEVEDFELSPTGKRRLRRLRRELDKVAGAIQEINIDGYADFTGRRSFNKQLSDKRAEAVKKYLLSGSGLAPGLFDVEGHGESRARADELNAPAREVDRRVDVEVVYK
jgi:outer membrane protein OmpA-like peptidoglycan-associated protein